MATVLDDDLGSRFATALAAKDRDGLLDVLAPDVDFLGLTPGRAWEATTAEALVDDVLLGRWFEPEDRIEAVEGVEHGAVVDRGRVAYRLRVVNPAGPHLVEQQAYFDAADGRIAKLRVLCSGFQPLLEG